MARAEQRGLPVIAFRRGVPFVEITEAIHGAIVNRQYALLRRGEAIHRRFTELVLEGQGIPEVMDALAAMIADPVVLESARGELLYHAVHGAATEAVLDAWGRHFLMSGSAGATGRSTPGSLPLPMADGAETGRLTALAVDSPLDDYDRLAVERAVGGSRSRSCAPGRRRSSRSAAAASSWPSSRRRARGRGGAPPRGDARARPPGAAPCCRWPSRSRGARR